MMHSRTCIHLGGSLELSITSSICVNASVLAYIGISQNTSIKDGIINMNFFKCRQFSNECLISNQPHI